MNSKIDKTNSNSVSRNDSRGYKYLNTDSKHKARQRATRLLTSMKVGEEFKQTSILPPYLIKELWNNKSTYEDRNTFSLIMEKSFDGGTNFYIQNKS